MRDRVNCGYLYETAMGDFCSFEKDACEDVPDAKCRELHIRILSNRIQDDVDELNLILKDPFLETFGDYMEALRNGFHKI